jgi:hypothetical protein
VSKLEIIPFGKYKGQPVDALAQDRQYCEWLLQQDWFPARYPAIHTLDSRDFAGAIRAAVWLFQIGFRIDHGSTEDTAAWYERHSVLSGFLVDGLRLSMGCNRRSRKRDLESLETVLEILLPKSSWDVYRKDIRILRRRGEPKDLMPTRVRRGGRPESEETHRMRAAAEYLKTRGSPNPYSDLAIVWTEATSYNRRYSGDSIRNRLRKGPPDDRDRGGSWLEFWRRIYDGDVRDVWPSVFPLSPELRMRKEALLHPSTSSHKH